MAHLGTLEGDGQLVIEGADAGRIRYTIDAWQDDNELKSAAGQIVGEPHILARAFENDIFLIRLADGASLKAFITYIHEDTADIQVNGPIPGF